VLVVLYPGRQFQETDDLTVFGNVLCGPFERAPCHVSTYK